jgi:hypothetical protein
MSSTLRLSEILGRGVLIEWFEAVALVRAVADALVDSVGGRSVPELDQIQLTSDGAVSILGTSATDEPVRRLGQLLQACLNQSDPPVQLRLTLAQATAPEPGYASIQDYSDALAYFERPDRPSVLRILYYRAESMPAAPKIAAPTLDAIAPLHGPEPRKQPKVKPTNRAKTSRAALVAIAAVVALVVAATAYSQFSANRGTDVSALALKASDAVGTTLVKGISAVSDSVGLGRLAPKDGSGAPAAATPAPTAPAPAKPVQTSKRAAVTPAAPAGFRVFDLAIQPLDAGVAAAAAANETGVSNPPAAGGGGSESIDTMVYSPSDPTVAEPIGLRPQLPRALPRDVRQDQLSQIELVILPDGTVDSVKLVGPRQTVLEGMLLSAAKAWTFKPALKDGRPVSYRKTVWLVRE